MRLALAALLLLSTTALSHNASSERCHEVRELCSRTCEPTATYIINATIPQPRLCDRVVTVSVACPGETGCERVEEVADVCSRRAVTRVPCTPGCTDEAVVPRDSPADYGTQGAARAVARNGYVELPFADAHPAVRNVRCFAGFFEEVACDGVSDVCRMGSRAFNSVLCSLKVCWQCRQIARFGVSKALERYCGYLADGVCQKVGGMGLERMGLGRMGLGRMASGRMALVGRTVDEEVARGRRRVCRRVGDVCERSVVQRYACSRKQVREGGCGGGCTKQVVRKVACGTHLAKAIGKETVRRCRRRYCLKRICE